MAKLKPYVCIHGHFYQPPRENPWLDTIELQESAHPYHNWNEKISAECYSQNSFSRILSHDKKIRKVINNYSYISFNIGPTLINWLKVYDPETYSSIIEADKKSQKRYSGHGSAIAQGYSHMILPLANRNDKITQVKWGIADFIMHFDRYPEGMWLPETAVDTETLEIMAENGLKFVILAPHQINAIRRINEDEWHVTKPHEADTTCPYLCKLPSGNSINIFLYNGAIAHAVGFGTLLNDGKAFAERLVQAGSDGTGKARLVNIATDGETFGHHHRFGDMALAFALDYITEQKLANITIYGEFLDKYPPEHEIRINDKTSWSCPHGVKRWHMDCGCNIGKQPGWHQKWRAPLRDSLDWLRDEINRYLEIRVMKDFKDFWRARNDYIQVVSNRDETVIASFMNTHLKDASDTSKYSFYIQIMELQRYMMLMYTSCGWFFDDISSIESIQILRYAIKVIDIFEKFYPEKFHDIFNEKVSNAHSNIPDKQNALNLIRSEILPGKTNPLRAGVHFAISLFYYGSLDKIESFQYDIKNEYSEKIMLPGMNLLFGRFRISDSITLESEWLHFICYEKARLDVQAYAAIDMSREDFTNIISELKTLIFKNEYSSIPVFISSHFKNTFSLRHVFKDTMVKISNLILNSAIHELDYTRTSIFYHNLKTITYMSRNKIRLPRQIMSLMSAVFSNRIIGIFREEKINVRRLNKYLKRGQALNVNLYVAEIEYTASQKIYSMIKKSLEGGVEADNIREIYMILDVLDQSFLEMDVWKVQNLYFKIRELHFDKYLEKAQGGDNDAMIWLDYFKRLGDLLKIHLE